LVLKEHLPSSKYFDLENPSDIAQLAEPELLFNSIKGLIVLDEIQHKPDLFPFLRGYVDRNPTKRFLVLGSASAELLNKSSETLAGRIIYHELQPLGIDELDHINSENHWTRGGFPRSLLASTDEASFDWRRGFIKTFVERDLPALGSQVQSYTHDRFWHMLAAAHGQVWNGARFGRAFGVADTTIRNYLDTLTSALVVQQLQPWFENIKKRQVKSPKVYIVDSGLLHALLDIETQDSLLKNPILSHSWEGYVISQVSQILKARKDQLFFWATHSGAEIDLLLVRGQEKIGFEIKRTTPPQYTKSMRSAVETLDLKKAFLIHAGSETFPLAENVSAIAFNDINELPELITELE